MRNFPRWRRASTQAMLAAGSSAHVNSVPESNQIQDGSDQLPHFPSVEKVNPEVVSDSVTAFPRSRVRSDSLS